jgi:hypothetical protein
MGQRSVRPMTVPDHTTPLKRCKKCSAEFPATAEFFYAHSSGKYGLDSYCRPCRITQVVQSQRKHPEARRKAKSAWKRAHRDQDRETQRRYRQRYPEKSAIKSLRWGRANPQKKKNISIRYRARKRDLPDNFTSTDWEYALTYFHGCCAVCGRPPGLWHTLAADHWIPLSSPNCPGTIPTNIVPLCHGINGCNNSKQDRDPVEWLSWKLGSREAKRKLAQILAYFSAFYA